MSGLQLASALHELVGELDSAADALLREEFGLTHSQLSFLMPLHREGAMAVSSLASANGVSVAAVSKRVSWFQDRDLIRAGHPHGDAKRVVLSLTPNGSRLVGRASARLAARLDEALADWPDRKRSTLNALVTDLTSTLRSNLRATRGNEG